MKRLFTQLFGFTRPLAIAATTIALSLGSVTAGPPKGKHGSKHHGGHQEMPSAMQGIGGHRGAHNPTGSAFFPSPLPGSQPAGSGTQYPPPTGIRLTPWPQPPVGGSTRSAGPQPEPPRHTPTLPTPRTPTPRPAPNPPPAPRPTFVPQNELPAPRETPAPQPRTNTEPFESVRMASTAEIEEAQREVDELLNKVGEDFDALLVMSVDAFLHDHARRAHIAEADVESYVEAMKTGDHVLLRIIEEQNGQRFEDEQQYYNFAQHGKNLVKLENQIEELRQAIASGASAEKIRLLRNKLAETWSHLDVTGRYAMFFAPIVAKGDVEGLFQSTMEELALLLDAQQRLAAAAEDPGSNDPGNEDPGSNDPGSNDPGSDDPGSDDPGSDDPGVPGGSGPIGPGRIIWVFVPTLPPGAVLPVGPGIGIHGSGNGCNCSCVVAGTPAVVGLPIPGVEPLPNAVDCDDCTDDRIVLINPSDNGGDVNFIIENEAGLLAAGDTQELSTASAVISFSRGGDFGEATYRLASGSYKFVVTDQGWELYRTKFQATLDNTANGQDFELLVGDEPATVPAGEIYGIESEYPIRVTFQDGVSEDLITKELTDDQVYTIGINLETEGWDLFPGDAETSGAGQPSDGRRVVGDDVSGSVSGDGSMIPEPDLEPTSDAPAGSSDAATDSVEVDSTATES